MIEQKSAPKKKKVGSLFFHLFNRLSLWIYTLLINSIPARLLTSYDVLEHRWNALRARAFSTPDGKLRQKLHRVRLHCAHLLEHSKILRASDVVIKFFIDCPLNVYGIFFFIYGAVSAAVYFVAERLSVDFDGNLGWGLAGLAIAVASLPLLGTSKPLCRAAFGSRIMGKLLQSYLGLKLPVAGGERKERSTTLMIYFALVLGLASGMLTFFFHPATLPIAVLALALAIMVFYVPETGVLLAAGTLGIWWTTGYPVVCAFAIAIVTLISFGNKLIRGKRVMHVRLIDFTVLLLASVFALQGIFVRGGLVSAAYGIGYAVLIVMYVPTVNLMRSREWLNRCYKLLAFSGVLLAVISVLPFAQIFQFLDMTFVQVDLSMMEVLFTRYHACFGQGTMVGGMLMLLLPLMLTLLMGKQTFTVLFWKVMCVLAACASVFLSMQIGVWAGMIAVLLVLIFAYSYRSLSTAMLLAFPVTCAAVWQKEINSLLGIQHLEIVQAAQSVLRAYANGASDRRAVAGSVLRMSADHLLGVGFGDHAVQSVFVYYAQPGMEHVTNIQNTYLQLVAECGYLGLIMLLAVILMFIICVLTYLRWGGNHTTKVRVVAGLAGVVGVLTMGLCCNMMNNASLFGLLWLVIGLTVASLRTQYDSHVRAVQTHAGTAERSDIAFRTR